MSALVLEALPHCAGICDVGALLPERLQGMDEPDICNMTLAGDARAGDCFAVSGVGAEHVILRGASMRLDNVGRGMRSGRITVEGDCGNFAGLGMRGGTISVMGNAGDFAACEMRAGLLEIAGNAGDFAGAALPGSMQGMRGGYLVVHGNAGDRAGDRMRRGMILVAGNVGACCGSRMLAGTILVKGRVGPMPGLALKRGTLVFSQLPSDLPATFLDCGSHRLLFLQLLDRELRKMGSPLSDFLPLGIEMRRFCGDLGTGGFGEMLVPVDR